MAAQNNQERRNPVAGKLTTAAVQWIRASGFDRGAFVQIAKAAFASVAAWELTLRWLGPYAPIYAALTALLTVGATVHQSVGSAVQRSLGAIAGVLVAAALTRWLGLTAFSLGLLLFVGLVVGRLIHLGPQGALQVAVSALLVMSIGSTRQHYASERVEGTIFGAVVGVLVNLAIAPPTSLVSAGRAMQKLVDATADLLMDMGRSARAGWTRDEALAWRARGRLVNDLASAARDALDSAEESLRYNPRERHTKEILGRYEHALDVLSRVVINTRNAARALREAAESGSAKPLIGGLDEPFERIAALVRAFSKVQLSLLPDASDDGEMRALARAAAQANADAIERARSLGDAPERWLIYGTLLGSLGQIVRELTDG